MSWIKDVRADVRQIDSSRKALRKFGVIVGGVLLGLTIFALISHGAASILMWVVGLLGTVLVSLGLIRPASLRVLQLYWMGIALAAGWVISRIILIVLFYGVVTPIAIFARVTGKKFLDIHFRDGAESYWIQKSSKNKVDYERMF